MNEIQMLAFTAGPITTLIVVMAGVLINNSRISDLSTRISDLRTDLEARMTDLRSDLEGRITDGRDTLRAEMARNHSEVLMKFAEMDHRLSRVEQQRGVIQ